MVFARSRPGWSSGDSWTGRASVWTPSRARHRSWNKGSFAALNEEGSVTTWGEEAFGGDSKTIKDDLTNIISIASPYTNERFIEPEITNNSIHSATDIDADGSYHPFSDGLIIASYSNHVNNPLSIIQDTIAESETPTETNVNTTSMQALDSLININGQRKTTKEIEDQLNLLNKSSVLDINIDEDFNSVDSEMLIRYGLGTFPGESLLDNLRTDFTYIGINQILEHITS